MAYFFVSCYIFPAFKGSVSLFFETLSLGERMTCMEHERIIIKYAKISFWILNQMQYQVRALRGHGRSSCRQEDGS